MPDENDPALNTIATIPQPHTDAHTDAPADQGPMPAELPPQPDLQPIQPGEKLNAAQLEALIGDTEASSAHELDAREGVDRDTGS